MTKQLMKAEKMKERESVSHGIYSFKEEQASIQHAIIIIIYVLYISCIYIIYIYFSRNNKIFDAHSFIDISIRHIQHNLNAALPLREKN